MEKKINIKKRIGELKKQHPLLESVSIQYHGSGDSFEEFWDINTTPEGIDIREDEMDDLLWYAIENSDADFNNDGSDGTITIDIKSKQLSIDNYYNVMESLPSGIKVF
jgi:hypothetical protein